MDGNIRFLDWLVIIVYFGGITLAGIYFARRNKDTEDYFVGGRNFSGWVIGLSLIGTSISSVSFMAYPGDAYKTAWLRLTFAFMMPIGIMIASRFFLPFYRRGKITTAYQYLQMRFGNFTQIYAGVLFILQNVMRNGSILFLLGLLIHELTGVSTFWCIIFAGIFVSFYTVAGGIEAVIWTDVVQTIVLVLGGLLCMVFIVYQLPGGFATMFKEAIADGKFKIAEVVVNTTVPYEGTETQFQNLLTFKPSGWNFTFYQKTGLMILFLGLQNWVFEYSGNQNVVQRYCASKSPREARKAMWICCFTSIPIWVYFMFLGTALYVYYKHFPNETAYQILSGQTFVVDGVEKTREAEQILPFFILTVLPQGIAGLVIAAVLAAAMSSLDSALNAMSTVSIVDIYRQYIAKDKDEKHYLFTARILAIVYSVLMILFAVWFDTIDKKTFQDTGILFTAFVGGGLFGIFMLGFFTKWGNDLAILIGAVIGTIYAVWRAGMHLEWWDKLPASSWLATDDYYTGFLVNLIVFVVAFLVGGIISTVFGKKRDLTNLTVYTQDDTPLD